MIGHLKWLLAFVLRSARPLPLALLLFVAPSAGHAVEPDEMLADPALEARAREISRGLRCLVCQNESIDESNAALARDLRLLVRERLVAGDSDGDVVQFIVDRYGDFVLLRPPLKPATYPLWASPIVLLVIAAAIIVVYLRRHRRAAPQQPLTSEERARVEELLKADREP
jgi:cytochrome c-type biogenesis protein CcmH